jgi:hypothetical protein
MSIRSRGRRAPSSPSADDPAASSRRSSASCAPSGQQLPRGVDLVPRERAKPLRERGRVRLLVAKRERSLPALPHVPVEVEVDVSPGRRRRGVQEPQRGEQPVDHLPPGGPEHLPAVVLEPFAEVPRALERAQTVDGVAHRTVLGSELLAPLLDEHREQREVRVDVERGEHPMDVPAVGVVEPRRVP